MFLTVSFLFGNTIVLYVTEILCDAVHSKFKISTLFTILKILYFIQEVYISRFIFVCFYTEHSYACLILAE